MGEAAALTMAMSWAAAGTAVTSLSARLPTIALTGLEVSFATAVILVALIASGQTADVVGAGAVTLLAVAGSGVIDFAVAEPLYIRALSVAGMQRTYGVTTGLYILFATVGGVVVLGERFTPGLPMGGALIIGGTYLIVTRWQRGPEHSATEVEAAAAPAGAGAALVAPAAATRKLEGYALLAIAPVLWTVATLWLASAGGELGAIPATAVRMTVGTVLLMGLLTTARRADLRYAVSRRRDLVTVAVASVGGISLANLLYVYALIEAGAARTAVLSATAPLFAIPFAIVFLRESLTRRMVLGTTLSVAGIIIVVSF